MALGRVRGLSQPETEPFTLISLLLSVCCLPRAGGRICAGAESAPYAYAVLATARRPLRIGLFYAARRAVLSLCWPWIGLALGQVRGLLTVSNLITLTPYSLLAVQGQGERRRRSFNLLDWRANRRYPCGFQRAFRAKLRRFVLPDTCIAGCNRWLSPLLVETAHHKGYRHTISNR